MTYGKRVAAQPTGSYHVQDKMKSMGNDMSMIFASHETVLRDHAVMIDEINDELDKLKGFYGWVVEAHPEILFQYKAIKDIQESSNA